MIPQHLNVLAFITVIGLDEKAALIPTGLPVRSDSASDLTAGNDSLWIRVTDSFQVTSAGIIMDSANLRKCHRIGIAFYGQ